MFCANCGTQMDDNAVFCPNCGTKTGAAQPAAGKGTTNLDWTAMLQKYATVKNMLYAMTVMQIVQLTLWFSDNFFIGSGDYSTWNFNMLNTRMCIPSEAEVLWGIGVFSILGAILCAFSLVACIYTLQTGNNLKGYLVQKISGVWSVFVMIYTWIAIADKEVSYRTSEGLTFGGWIVMLFGAFIVGLAIYSGIKAKEEN